jgi:hypothetical protein
MNTLLFALLAVLAFNAPQFASISIQGIVLRAGTTEPLSNVNVELRTIGNNPVTLDSITTERDGRFFLPNVRPGRFELVATRSGYVRAPLTITVIAGQQTPEMRLPMTPTAAIEGRVYNGINGEPYGNIEVQALKASYQDGRRVFAMVHSQQTNDLGEYRIFWLAPGRYYIRVVHPDAQGMFRRMMMSSGSTGMSIGGTFGGFFSTNSTGDPALEIYRDEESERDTPRYVPIYFPGTPDEQLATAIDLRPGADFGGVNIVVAPVRPRHVRGFVVDGGTGKPAQNAQVRLAVEGPMMTGPNGPNEIQVDENSGAFDITLLPGSHTLVGTSGVGIGYTSVQVRDADIENVTIVPMPPFDIAGRISADSPDVTSADLERLRLSLRREPSIQGTSPTSYSHPLSTGAFTLAAGPGNFRVNITPIPEGAYVKSIRLGNADVLNAGLRLERPPAVPLEIVVGTNPGAIEGATAAADVSIVLVPDVRLRTDLFESTVSDSSGRFRFDRIPPGNYKIFAWQEVENGAWFDPEFLRTYENGGQPIQVTEGTTLKVQVQ